MTPTTWVTAWLLAGFLGGLYCSLWSCKKERNAFSRGELMKVIICSPLGVLMLAGALFAFMERLDHDKFWTAPLNDKRGRK